MAETRTYISLREVGRRLGIPPSTVVYYKDRFGAHIPSEGGDGRRRRYPQEVLGIFRSIREMFDNNWSAEQIDEALAERRAGQEQGRSSAVAESRQAKPAPPFGSGRPMNFTDPERFMAGPAGGLGPGLGPDAAVVIIEQLSLLARNQAELGAALKGLNRDLATLRSEGENQAEDRLGRLERLETELEGVRRMLFDLADRVAGAEQRADSGDTSGDASGKARGSAGRQSAGQQSASAGPRSRAASGGLAPSEAFLSRPLVIRTLQGEYLGVLGGGRKHFTLGDFITLMERNISSRRAIETRWRSSDGQWVLEVNARDVDTGSDQSILLVVRKTTTPSRNVVTEIVRLNIDGSDVPDSLLLSLFKQVRDEFSTGC